MSEKEILGQGNWLRLQKVGRWEWVSRVNATGVVGLYAFTDANEVVLVEQPRAPLDARIVLEIPAGLVGDVEGKENEPMAQAAHRELEEETGYRAGDLREIVETPTCPGLTGETIHLFVARDLKKVGPGGGDDTEDITVILVPMAEFADYLKGRMDSGVYIDPKVFAVPFFAGL